MNAQTTITNVDREMILVPAGVFIQGSADFGPETPAHQVDLAAFYIDRYPVTSAEYACFTAATGHRPPPYWPGGLSPDGQADHPVIMVNWYDARDYAAWAGKRLPSEAEWEKAARGVDERRYPWGDVFDESRTLVWENAMIRGLMTMPVTAHASGASPFGVCQAAGHVEEWVDDWYEAYAGSSYQSRGYGQKFKVLKGGSWFYTQQYARCAFRRPLPPESLGWAPVDGPGFRCAMDVR